jgi:hypothetical protein
MGVSKLLSLQICIHAHVQALHTSGNGSPAWCTCTSQGCVDEHEDCVDAASTPTVDRMLAVHLLAMGDETRV